MVAGVTGCVFAETGAAALGVSGGVLSTTAAFASSLAAAGRAAVVSGGVYGFASIGGQRFARRHSLCWLKCRPEGVTGPHRAAHQKNGDDGDPNFCVIMLCGVRLGMRFRWRQQPRLLRIQHIPRSGNRLPFAGKQVAC